jgi:hypothetical protein
LNPEQNGDIENEDQNETDEDDDDNWESIDHELDNYNIGTMLIIIKMH